MDRSRIVPVAVLSAVIAVYIAARFWRLTDSCLWFDEIFSIHAAEHPWNELFSFVALDLIHPPLFYVVLKIWIAVGGEGLFWLRSLPVIISCIAIIPFLLLCRQLKQKTYVAALALLFLAVNGSLIKYAQEVRMYSLLLCLGLFSMWLFARFIDGKRGYLALIVVNVLLVYTHYFGWLVVLTEVIWIVFVDRTRRRQIFLMTGVVIAAFLPWTLTLWQSVSGASGLSQNIGWITRPGPRAIATFVFDLVEPFYYQAERVEPASIYRVSVPILIVILVSCVAMIARWIKNRKADRTIYFLSLFAALPLITVFVASWLLPYSIWGIRHLIIIAPAVALLIATGLARLERPFRTAAVTLMILFSGHAFYLQFIRPTPEYFWCEWEPAARAIALAESRTPGPVKIYTFEPLVAYQTWFALRNADRFQVHIVQALPGMPGGTEYFLPRGFDNVRPAALDEVTAESIWLAFRTERSGEEDAVLEGLTRRGYAPCPSARKQFGTTTTFSIKMTRDPGGCY